MHQTREEMKGCHATGCRTCTVYDRRFCGRMYRSRKPLDVHERTHTGERPFMCNECGKTFREPECLATHKRTVHMEPRFKCSYCPKALKTKESLADHVRRHTGERPFLCPDCGNGYSAMNTMKTHRRIAHKIAGPNCKPVGEWAREKKKLAKNEIHSQH